MTSASLSRAAICAVHQGHDDLAEKTLSELESNKPSLPASVQSQLPTARTALNAAKMSGGDAGGMTIPDLPK